MTEQDWLVSEDPSAMWGWLAGEDGLTRDHFLSARRWIKVSDRKLRLFACACCRLAKPCPDEWEDHLPAGWRDVRQWAGTVAAEDFGVVDPESQRKKAALLREIVGNVFRPVGVVCKDFVSNGPRPHLCKTHKVECIKWGVSFRCPESFQGKYVTPQVLSLAQAAYDERPGRKCEKCGGTGEVKSGDDYGYFLLGCEACGGDGRTTWRDGGGWGPPVVENGRKGTGVVVDGSLDPFRFAMLADALEEAGCTDEAILMHLRGFEERSDLPSLYGEKHWRPLPGPHVRGCWVVDLTLGKE